MATNTSHVSFFVPTQLREALEQSARENDRSLSAEVRVAIRAHVSDPSVATPREVAAAAEGQEAS